MKRTVLEYLVMILGIMGSIASIVALLCFKSFSKEGWVAVLFLGLICVYFIIYNFWLLSIYRKRARYAYAYEDINMGFAALHQLRRKENVVEADIVSNLEIVCTTLSGVFGRIYGTNIAVSIKYIVSGKDGRPKVETLVRDGKSKMDRPTGKGDAINHWIEKNTDFNFIYQNIDDKTVDTSFFLERHLPQRHDYQNTRLGKDWPPTQCRWSLMDRWVRSRNWKLKYKSTLVVPVVPLCADEHSLVSLRGFLCIDSPHEGQFNDSFDVAILKGIADGLYNQIDKIYTLSKSNNN